MAALAEVAPVKRVRIESVDVVRGVIMITMALDHVRDFFGNLGVNPTDPATTTIPLFFTRWITHFCAPVFFLLTGTGAYLSLRKKSKGELSRFLFTRGLWLIFLELVVVRDLGWQFNFDYRLTLLIVLWALGWSMIVLSGLVSLPAWAVTAFGLVMIATHNLFDSVDSGKWLWSILHSPNILVNNARHTVFVLYPLIPWIGVTAAGYGLGQVYSWPAERRRKFLLPLGIGLSLAFVALRAINIYGDPQPWSAQRSAVFTVLSFLNTTKYPPSLLFLLMTLGPATIFLWAVDTGTPRWLRPALIVGKVPMFYYLLHVPLIHLIAVAVCYARYGHVYWMFQSPSLRDFPITPPPGWGYSLPVVYLVWAGVVLALYPLCRWFAGVKQRRGDAWLSYF
ncbi:MAG TPA: heparan-alpha-glucosaminide N-acetyltransferase domain-containing protein [Candidatus Sulfotelmatobacter sp.]|nr:heparan-alpha-glucosaminide N-acetyltransferase domain-containing protein [Candidatus Sulfotelmatobacter sp.]